MTSIFLRVAAAIIVVGILAALLGADPLPLIACGLSVWALYHVAKGLNKSSRR